MPSFSLRIQLAAVLALVAFAPRLHAQTTDLGNGFRHHGVATPVSSARGMVATSGAPGRKVLLVWLFDHRGGYALLEIDVDSGASRQFPTPFPPGGDCPYASILSSANRYYTHFNSHFVEFDPARGKFTFAHKTTPQMAMSMTEDDAGVIWSVTYPNSGLVSYDPATGAFKDYGSLNKENWRQYPRYIAADDQGWIYFGIGSTTSQIIAFDPATGNSKPATADGERAQGYGVVYRGVDGNVYGHHPGINNWYRFHGGEAVKIGAQPHVTAKSYISGSQGLFHRVLPDGRRVETCDLVTRTLTIKSARTGKLKSVHFDYSSEGAHIMGVAAAPNGTICGGTAFPMRFFSYDPATDRWINRASYGQWNMVARQGDHFFVGGYGGGFLLRWDPEHPWIATVKGKRGCNPQFLVQAAPDINRPHELLAHPDGKTLVLAGTPGYGYTGGGLLFWDRATRTHVLLRHTDILPQHSTMSLVALAGGKLLGGTTTAAGTGGEKKARVAELYIMDMASKKIEWHDAVFRRVQGYSDMCPGPDGLVYGVADYGHFFVFDPVRRVVIHDEIIREKFGPTCSQQGPRILVPDTHGRTFILFRQGIGQIDPKTYQVKLLAKSPVPIGPGGDVLNGRIYFGSGSHLYSFAVPLPGEK